MDDLFENGGVHLYIPNDQDISVDTALSVDVIKASAQRETLFYDEEVHIYVELALNGNTQFQPDDLEKIHATVNVNVSGHQDVGSHTVALNPNNPTSQAEAHSSAKDFEIVTKVATKDDLIYSSSSIAIWRVLVLIKHPRVRLIDPAVTVTAVVSLDKDAVEEQSTIAEADKESETSASLSSNSRNALFFSGIEPIEGLDIFRPLATTTTKPLTHMHTANKGLVGFPPDVVRTGFSVQNSRKRTDLNHSRNTSVTSVQSLRRVSGGSSSDAKTNTGANVRSQSAAVPKLTGVLKIPVQPAINLRIVSLTPQGKPDEVVTLLELSVPEKSKYRVSVGKVELRLMDEPATLLGSVDFPFIVQPGEFYLMSYYLVYTDISLGALRKKVVTISSESSPVIDDETMDLGPLIRTQWETLVDFDADYKDSAGVGNPKSPGLNMYANPVNTNNNNNSNNNNNRKLGMLGGYRPSRSSSNTSLVTSVSMGQPHADPLRGVSISFTGPSSVKLGETFFWTVFVINKSATPKHLSLYFQSRDSVQSSNKSFADKLANTYSATADASGKPGLSIDRTTLRRLAAQTTLPDMGIISLVNDVRIGPLEHEASYKTSIQLLALTEGIHTLEGVIVVDLDSGEGHECGKLLEIFVTG